MNITLGKDGFSEINTVVLYSFSAYIPLPEDCGSMSEEDISKFRGVYKWRGSKNSMELTDLLLYGLDVDVEREKFATTILPNLYGPEIKSQLGSDTIMNSLSSFIPSVSEVEERVERWFGSIVYNDKTLTVLSGDSMIWMIECYEEKEIESNNSSHGGFLPYSLIQGLGLSDSVLYTPAMVVTLGPSPLDHYNSVNSYLEIDSRRSPEAREEVITSLQEWSKLWEEISAEKVITIALTQSVNTPEVNLSQKAWDSALDPLRNMHKTFLRNDFLGTVIKDMELVKENQPESGVWVDRRSGTMLGHSKKEGNLTPVLTRKLRRLQKFPFTFSPYRSYKEREIVEWDGEKWMSLENLNMGNLPNLSPAKWIRAEGLDSIYTQRVRISSGEGGTVNPSGYLTVLSPTEHHIFEVLEELGYKLDPEKPAMTSEGNYITGFEITQTEENQRSIKKIDVWEWDEALKTGKMIFCFLEEGSTVIFRIELDNRVQDYEEWKNIVNCEDIYIENLETEEKYYFEDDEGIATAREIPIRRDLKFSFPYLKAYQPEILSMSNTLGENVENLETRLILEDERYTTQITSNFTSASWILNLVSRILTIAASGTGFEFSNPVGEVNFGTPSYSIDFYCVDEELTPEDWIVEINGEEIKLGEKKIIDTATIDYGYESYRDVYTLRWSGSIEISYTITITKK